MRPDFDITVLGSLAFIELARELWRPTADIQWLEEYWNLMAIETTCIEPRSRYVEAQRSLPGSPVRLTGLSPIIF